MLQPLVFHAGMPPVRRVWAAKRHRCTGAPLQRGRGSEGAGLWETPALENGQKRVFTDRRGHGLTESVTRLTGETRKSKASVTKHE